MNEPRKDDFEKALDVIAGELLNGTELALILKVSKSTISDWSNGKKFDDSAVLELGSTRRYILSRVIKSLQRNYNTRHKR